MRNIKLIIEYEGTNYCGWQIQRKPRKIQRVKGSKSQRKTIQEELEKALRQLLQEKVKVIGSGRTDSGVHALGQVANFRTKTRLKCKNIQQGLNTILPEDIRIRDAEAAPPNFHARFLAKSKLYRYTITNASFVSPHLRHFSYLVKFPLNVQKMRQGASYLLGKHDFRSFQAKDKRVSSSVRTIRKLDIYKRKDQIFLDIEADGFLYRMVRNIAGTLLEIGRGRLKAEDVREILRAKDRAYAGPCAVARGLCLVRVNYKSSKKR